MTTKKPKLDGEVFGKLRVTRELPKEERLGNKSKVTWECICECGGIHKATTHQLRSGKRLSCGCDKEPTYEDLTGNIYEMLTVIKPIEKRSKHRQLIWMCLCECGRLTEQRSDNLKSGGAYSCGCARRLNNGDDLAGTTVGELKILHESPKSEWIWDGKHRTWICECSCGEMTKAITKDLKLNRKLHCGCLTSSIGEVAVEHYLINNSVPHVREYTFDDLYYLSENHPLRFDFAILDPRGDVCQLIEYDGGQHFTPVDYFGGEDVFNDTVERDQLKNEYCKKHNIPLLRIPYTEYNNIDKILDQELRVLK